MNDLSELLTAIRSNYVDQFEAALNEARAKGEILIVEPPMLNEAGELAREGALNLGARYDFAVQSGDSASPSMFEPARMLTFSPTSFHGGGLLIEIAPFSWDGVAFLIDGPPVAVAVALADWFEEAICAPEGVAEDGIQHAAHFFSDPIVDGERSLAQADLGTVDVDLVIGLFNRLRQAGASRVELGLPSR